MTEKQTISKGLNRVLGYPSVQQDVMKIMSTLQTSYLQNIYAKYGKAGLYQIAKEANAHLSDSEADDVASAIVQEITGRRAATWDAGGAKIDDLLSQIRAPKGGSENLTNVASPGSGPGKITAVPGESGLALPGKYRTADDPVNNYKPGPRGSTVRSNPSRGSLTYSEARAQQGPTAPHGQARGVNTRISTTTPGEAYTVHKSMDRAVREGWKQPIGSSLIPVEKGKGLPIDRANAIIKETQRRSERPYREEDTLDGEGYDLPSQKPIKRDDDDDYPSAPDVFDPDVGDDGEALTLDSGQQPTDYPTDETTANRTFKDEDEGPISQIYVDDEGNSLTEEEVRRLFLPRREEGRSAERYPIGTEVPLTEEEYENEARRLEDEARQAGLRGDEEARKSLRNMAILCREKAMNIRKSPPNPVMRIKKSRF